MIRARQMSKSMTLTSIADKSPGLERTLITLPLPPCEATLDDKIKVAATPLEGKWNSIMEGMLSTPAHVIRQSNGDCQGRTGGNLKRPRQVYSKNVLETMPTLPTRNVTPENSTSNPLSLIPPKIRLQILSPVHSRQQVRVPSVNKNEIEEYGAREGLKATTTEASSIWFLKHPTSQHFQFEESRQEMTSSAYVSPRMSKHSQHSFNHVDEEYISPKQNRSKQELLGTSKQRRQISKQTPSTQLKLQVQRTSSKNKNNVSHSPKSHTENDYDEFTHDSDNMISPRSPPRSKEKLHTLLPNKFSKNRSKFSTLPLSGNKTLSYGRNIETPVTAYETDRGETREMTALSQSSSRRKLKVRGLKNFVDTHKPCHPPLWAKQFPCRSKFHPDNYLYDFEGFNAPKRPVAAMDKCSKKCGRCNRCGVYVDDMCGRCNMCAADCSCKSKPTHTHGKGHGTINNSGNSASSKINNIMPTLPSPGGGSFAPTAEHFISQLFGNGWSQTQKIEVNTLAEPDKPRLNLHQASSNNPLKIKHDKPEESTKPVHATGYDTYAPATESAPPPPSYPPYSYGYGYPGYPTPAPYPYPYYPTYSPVPPPMPTPYYSYPAPSPMPSYNYSTTAP